MSTKEECIAALEQYERNEISGEELLNIWRTAPEEIYIVYYNLHHLTSDEDIRRKDAGYAEMQFQHLRATLKALKADADEETLANFCFLYQLGDEYLD